MISIRMLKLSGESTYKPLNLLFKFCVETAQFLSWKRPMLSHFLKRVTNSYQKIIFQFHHFPSLMKSLKDYNQMFEPCIRNQSGLKLSDSCIS